MKKCTWEVCLRGYQCMTKKYKVDKSKIIGNVIFVVEGGRPDTGGTELRLLKSIFSDILEYEVQELRRDKEEFIGYGNNKSSRVFALNLPKNQLTQLTEDAMDELFSRLKTEFLIKPEDCPIFLLYDRDYKSYKHNELGGRYVRRYTDPYSSEEGYQGQLLLSYPSVESYILSCVQENVFEQRYFLGPEAKAQVKQCEFSEDDISEDEHIIHATVEMDKGLANFGLDEYDLDNLGSTLLGVYEEQQNIVKEEQLFSALSLISMALLELGVIVEYEDDEEEEEKLKKIE